MNKLTKSAPQWHAEAKQLLTENFGNIHSAFQDATKRAVWMGMFLNHIKEKGKADGSIPHGQFMPWLETAMPEIPGRTLRTYMDLGTGVCEKNKFQIGQFSQFAGLPGHLPAVIDKAVEGKTQQQLFLSFKNVDADGNARKPGQQPGSKGLTKVMRLNAKFKDEDERMKALAVNVPMVSLWLKQNCTALGFPNLVKAAGGKEKLAQIREAVTDAHLFSPTSTRKIKMISDLETSHGSTESLATEAVVPHGTTVPVAANAFGLPMVGGGTLPLQPVLNVREHLDRRQPVMFKRDEVPLFLAIPNAPENNFLRDETELLCTAVEMVLARSKTGQSVQAACKEVIRQFPLAGWKLNTFRGKYDLWIKQRDWTVLVNFARAGGGWIERAEALPPAFVAYGAQRAEELKGNVKEACRSLRRQWQTGLNYRGKPEAIAGYEILADGSLWLKRDVKKIPAGWTAGNLARHINREFKVRELPGEFVSFWKLLCELHQRTTAGAHNQLVKLWREKLPFEIRGTAYEMIPGYTDWPAADPRTDLPPGWTESNLNRFTPDDYELTAARIGVKTAGNLGFKIRTSRLGLRLGEFMEFDDHEFNVKVNFPGQLRALRPRCFGAVDALTDCMFSMVIKPTFWDMEAEMKRTLTEKDFMWFIVAVLTHRGYRADVGTMLLVEWGTSAIRGNLKLKINDPLRDDFEKRIFDCTGGKVRVDRGGRFRKQANPGQFAPPAGGNFRFKPHVEQFWRMLDDWLDALKGQVGKGRDFAPEEMERADAYNNKLLKAARALGTEQAARLILPRMTFAEFTQTANVVMGLVNDDRDHECNSWNECGFITKEFRRDVAAPWQPLQLLASEPAEIQNAVMENDLLFRPRRMTRMEADRKHQHELTPLPMMMIPALVGPQFAREPVIVRGGKFYLQDKNDFCTPDALVFQALDAAGSPLREGEVFIPYVNPMSPDALVICDARGAVVSVCPPDLQPCRNNEAGIQRAMGVKNHWTAAKLAPQRERHAEAGIGVEFMREHNAQIVSTAAPVERVVMPTELKPDCTEELLSRANQVPAPDAERWD